MRARQAQLHLHEEIMLLALRDKEGTIAASTYVYALGGAILAEFLLSDRVGFDKHKGKLIEIEDARPYGEPVLDECLAKIRTAKRRANAQTWVGRFAQMSKLKHRVAMGLCDRGILKADEKTILLLFKQRIYPERDPAPERRIVERLRRAIFSDSNRIQPRTIVLLSLAKNADLLKYSFDKKRLRQRRKRIERITSGELMGKATKQAIDAANAAIVVLITCT